MPLLLQKITSLIFLRLSTSGRGILQSFPIFYILCQLYILCVAGLEINYYLFITQWLFCIAYFTDGQQNKVQAILLTTYIIYYRVDLFFIIQNEILHFSFTVNITCFSHKFYFLPIG